MSHVQYELRISYTEELDSYMVDVLQDGTLLKSFMGDLLDCLEEAKLFISKQI